MKSILMTTSAVLLVTGAAVRSAGAACPEDIDTFNRQYEEALQSAAAGQALTASEQAELFGLKTAAENLHAAGNADMCAEVIDRANATLESAIAPQVIRPDELIGRDVTNAAEEDLGEVEQIMLDPVSGRIAYVLIEHGGFLGIGDNLFAVPWRALGFVPGDDEKVILEIPEERLENAPRFSREDETPLERREWVTSVHNYYGVAPYWQDDVQAAAAQFGGAPQQPAGAATTRTQAEVLVIPAEPADEAQTGAPAEGASSGAAPGDAGTQPQIQGEPGGATEPGTEPEPKTENETGTGTGGTGTQGTLQPGSETQAQGGPGDSAGSAGEQPGQAAGSAEAEAGMALAAQPQAEPEPASGSEQQTMAAVPAGGSGQDAAALAERIEQLESRVQSLSEQGNGDEVARLEERVQALEEQLETEVMDRLSRLEEQATAGAATAAGGGGGTQQAAGVAGQQGEGQEGQAQAPQPQTAQQNTQQADGQEAQPGPGAPAAMQAAGQGGQGSDQAAPDGQASAGQKAEPRQGGSDDVSIAVVPAEQGGAAAGAAQQQSGAASGASQQPAEGAGAGQDGGGAGQPEERSVALQDAQGGLSCEAGIELIQEDLERAEEAGIVIQDAWNDLRDAEANAGSSEALCRAAIKRAHEEIAAAGFEPTPIE